jgi:hypothetical protein
VALCRNDGHSSRRGGRSFVDGAAAATTTPDRCDGWMGSGRNWESPGTKSTPIYGVRYIAARLFSMGYVSSVPGILNSF